MPVNDSAELDIEARGLATVAPAVTRAAAILDALAEQPAAATPLSDLARRLGLPKSSVANICAALVDAGLVRRAGAGFTLGRRLAELGGAYLATVDQVQEFDDLDEVRRRGHAIDDEETAEGIVCLGVAIPRRSGAEQYGVSVTLLKARADAARIDALAADLKRLARLLANPLIASRRDGHVDA